MKPPRYFGKYRGIVDSNADPLMQARIQVRVPDVLGAHVSGWAMPCLPFTGDRCGVLAVPPAGAGVWVEFEQGDPDYPVWCGGWWGSAAELPPATGLPGSVVVVRTPGGHQVVLDDTPGAGGIRLETSTGQRIALDATGIEIDDGLGATIRLTGPQVTVNDGALEVI